VQYKLLHRLLEHEGSQFYSVSQKWQPKSLIPDPYRRNLLKDAQGRFKGVSEAEAEFRTLDRAHQYVQLIRRMRLTVRAAQFAWRFDDLKFLESISSFFTDYGTVLRLLKFDSARGRLNDNPPKES
jgi:hypothetical protein